MEITVKHSTQEKAVSHAIVMAMEMFVMRTLEKTVIAKTIPLLTLTTVDEEQSTLKKEALPQGLPVYSQLLVFQKAPVKDINVANVKNTM